MSEDDRTPLSAYSPGRFARHRITGWRRRPRGVRRERTATAAGENLRQPNAAASARPRRFRRERGSDRVLQVPARLYIVAGSQAPTDAARRAAMLAWRCVGRIFGFRQSSSGELFLVLLSFRSGSLRRTFHAAQVARSGRGDDDASGKSRWCVVASIAHAEPHCCSSACT